jgi:hypothetical protein
VLRANRDALSPILQNNEVDIFLAESGQFIVHYDFARLVNTRDVRILYFQEIRIRVAQLSMDAACPD